MHPLPRRILRQLLTDYGPALLNEPARVDALLADLSGPYHCERFLLFHALRERISIANWPVAVWLGSCSQRLQKRYCFSAEAAAWAVESWSLALGIAPTNSDTNHNGKEIRDDSHATLSEIPQRTLYQLLTNRGPDQLNDPERVDALLADMCRPYPRERFLLFHPLRERIPTQLALVFLAHAPRQRALAAHLTQQKEGAIHASWLLQRFQNWYGFSAEAAQWVVESCSFALNIASPVQYQILIDDPTPFVNEKMLQILQHNARFMAWVSAEVLTRQRTREQNEAVVVAPHKDKEREAAEEAVRQKTKKRKAEKAVSLERANETIAAQEAVLTKAEEWVTTKVADHQKIVGLSTAKAADHQKAKEWFAAEAAVLQKAEEWVATKAADHQKTEEWVAAKAVARQKMFEWAAAEKAVRVKAEEQSVA